MPLFEYRALNAKGRTVSGMVTAEGAAAARFKLTARQVYPMELREIAEGDPQLSRTRRLGQLLRMRRVNPLAAAAALRQLATLVSSGLPLAQCLETMVDQLDAFALKRVYTRIRVMVVEGNALSDAMASHPWLFDEVHVNMVRAGEDSGALALILNRLADFSETRVRLKKKVESSMIYPAFLILISAVILAFLMTFVMPKVVGIFQGLDMALPWPTRLLIDLSSFLRSYWWLVLAALAVSIGTFILWSRSEAGRLRLDRLRLALPYFGSLHGKIVVARFARTLSILLDGGIPLHEALGIAGPSMGNRILEDDMRQVARRVKEGDALSAPLRRNRYYPPVVVQLVRAGEQSGELGPMLAKSADIYENETETALAAVTSFIEPAVILLMGFAVGFIVMAILLPIFDMTSGIHMIR